MKKLYLDTTISRQATVKIFENEKLLAEVKSDSPLISISEALKEAGLELKDIDQFEANPGPGSYTGIRVGAIVINTLNWALGKEAKSVEPIYQ